MPREALALSSVVIYELQAGAERTRLQDSTRAADLDRWIAEMPRQIGVLPFGEDEARITATLMAKRTLDLLPDAMIAATAAAYGLTVVTRNTKDFLNFPIKLLNPFLS